MEGKGIIKFFFVMILIVTAWQYFQILPTLRVENKAEAYAQKVADSEENVELQEFAFAKAKSEYLDSMSTETVLSIPLIKKFSYDELKKSQLGLGLDLKGGMSVVMQVDLRDFLVRLSQNNENANFRRALDEADERLKNAQDDYITLFADAYNEIEGAQPLARIFAPNQALSDDIDINSSNGQVINVLRQRANGTVQNTFDRLKERIDRLGTTQPNVTLDAARDLILVELPGIENPERARKFLVETANLEFYKTYRATDPGVLQSFVEINNTLRDERLAESGEVQDSVEWEYTTDSLGNVIDSFEVGDLEEEENPLFEVFSASVDRNGQPIASPVVGYALKNNRDEVMAYLKRDDFQSLFPADLDFAWGRDPILDEDKNPTNTYALYALKKDRGPEPHLSGEVITNAQAVPDPQQGMVVSIRMNNQGAQTWAELTGDAYNNGGREIAILLDEEVVSAPSVNNGAITGGSSQISGDFTLQEAQDLASKLEVGKLPARTEIIQDAVVGPSLGADNIRKSIISLSIGLILVLLFMIFYYGKAGVVSIIALILNMFILLAALAGINTVLTLPGVAGIVLTIGMAVDANVIIFERIREELRLGKVPLAAVRDGFKASYSAIIDANVTSLFTAIILLIFGLGPIKGFAIVLIVGILSSFFTAVLIGRLMIEGWITAGREMSFWIPPTKNVLADLKIDWLSKRKIAYGISSLIIVAGIISMVTRGFELGVDFKGGYSYNVEFPVEQDIDLASLREATTSAFDEASTTVKAVSTQNTFNVVTSYLIDSDSEDSNNQVLQRLHQGVQAAVGQDVDFENFKDIDGDGIHISTSAKVGPTIADDIKNSSIWATIFSLLVIFMYIFIRFSNWQYSLGAVAALFHDTLIVLSIFSIGYGWLPFSLEIDQAFIGALLTVIGYSINDTVVVFDRIREYLNIYTNKSKKEVINKAVNGTISRTVITSLTTLFVVLVLFIFGGTSIKGMAFALVVGVIVGTYSSVFVATPIMSDLSGELSAKNAKKGRSFSKHVAKS